MGVAIAAAVIGAAASAGGAYLSSRSKTKIPQWDPMDIGGEASKALASNETNFAGSAALTSKANAYNQDEILKMLRRVIPGFDSMMAQGSKTLESGLKGEIPEDVQKQISLFAASKAVGGGYAGSGAHRNLVARDFGMTSYGITQQSLKSVESWTRSMASLFTPGMTSIASSFISPESWIKQKQSDKENAWRVSMGQAIEDSRPGPGAMAGSSLLGTAGGAASLYAGYKFGQMGESPVDLTESDLTPVTRDWGNPFSAVGAARRT